jgi:hypothetical protein
MDPGEGLRPASAVPRHPLALMLPTLLADTTRQVRHIGAVLEIVPTSGHEHRKLGLTYRPPLADFYDAAIDA